MGHVGKTVTQNIVSGSEITDGTVTGDDLASDIAINTTGTVTVGGTSNLTISDGNLVIGTSGHGISFAATSDATDMSSELLDDYEKGVFTYGTNANASFDSGTNIGRYIKVGKLVHISMYIQVNSVSGTNHFYISGLPFTNATATSGTYNSAVAGTLQVYQSNFDDSAKYLTTQIGTASTNIYMYEVFDNANWSILTNSEVSSSTEMCLALTYESA